MLPNHTLDICTYVFCVCINLTGRRSIFKNYEWYNIRPEAFEWGNDTNPLLYRNPLDRWSTALLQQDALMFAAWPKNWGKSLKQSYWKCKRIHITHGLNCFIAKMVLHIPMEKRRAENCIPHITYWYQVTLFQLFNCFHALCYL